MSIRKFINDLRAKKVLYNYLNLELTRQAKEWYFEQCKRRQLKGWE